MSEILEDDTTKKPATVAPAVAAVVTSSPFVAEKPVVIAEPVKETAITPAETIANEIIPVEVSTIADLAQNDEKLAEPIEAETMMPMPEKVDAVAEPVKAESDAPVTVVETLANEVVSQAPLADAPVATPTKATSEEEGLLEGIINTLTFDDAEDDDGE